MNLTTGPFDMFFNQGKDMTKKLIKNLMIFMTGMGIGGLALLIFHFFFGINPFVSFWLAFPFVLFGFAFINDVLK